MMKHIVLWKLKESAEGNSRETNARLLAQKLEALPAVIPEIEAFEVGINLEKGDYDVGLYSAFRDEDALRAYQIHPAHVAVKEFISKIRDTSAAFDYTI